MEIQACIMINCNTKHLYIKLVNLQVVKYMANARTYMLLK